MMVQLYYSFVYPCLKYGIVAWGNINKKLTNKVQVLQNKISEILSFKSLKDRPKMCTIYKSMHILQFKDIFELEIAKFMYAYHNDKLPNNFDGIFNPVQNQHNYGTRSIAKKKSLCAKNAIARWLFLTKLLCIEVKIWNKILVTIKSLPQYAFSKQCKNLLLHKYWKKVIFGKISCFFYV